MGAWADHITALVPAVSGIGGVPLDKDDLNRLAEILARYGEGSASSLENGVDTVREKGREMLDAADAQIPEWGHQAMGFIRPMMPGAAVMDSMRMAGEAGRHFREGRTDDGVRSARDAAIAPFNELFFALPGGGFVKKAAPR